MRNAISGILGARILNWWRRRRERKERERLKKEARDFADQLRELGARLAEKGFPIEGFDDESIARSEANFYKLLLESREAEEKKRS